MSPEANSLVAVVVAVGTALVACAAAMLVVLARRTATGAARARAQLAGSMATLRRDGPLVRGRIAVTADRVDQLRERWAETDQAMTDVTTSLAGARSSLVRLTQGRLAMLIRGAGIVSKAAQFALLWR